MLFADLLKRGHAVRENSDASKRAGRDAPPTEARCDCGVLLQAERAPGVENTMRFPPGPHIVDLQVDLEEDAYPRYEAVLETADRAPVARLLAPRHRVKLRRSCRWRLYGHDLRS